MTQDIKKLFQHKTFSSSQHLTISVFKKGLEGNLSLSTSYNSAKLGLVLLNLQLKDSDRLHFTFEFIELLVAFVFSLFFTNKEMCSRQIAQGWGDRAVQHLSRWGKCVSSIHEAELMLKGSCWCRYFRVWYHRHLPCTTMTWQEGIPPGLRRYPCVEAS